MGRALVDHLKACDGISLLVVSRNPPSGVSAGISWFQHDLASGLALPDAIFADVNCVVHGAAHLRHLDADDYVASSRLNFSVTADLYKKAVDHGVGKVVYLSGLNFLKRPMAACIDESHEVGPTTPYALGKLWGELALFSMLRDTSVTPVALRITSPVPKRWEELHDTVLRRWILAARAGQPIVVYGSGGRLQDYVSMSDVAGAVESAIRLNCPGVFNIATGRPVSNLEVARFIASRYGVPIEFSGVDPEECLTWNVCVSRAGRDLGYIPSGSSLDAIRTFIEHCVQEDRRRIS